MTRYLHLPRAYKYTPDHQQKRPKKYYRKAVVKRLRTRFKSVLYKKSQGIFPALLQFQLGLRLWRNSFTVSNRQDHFTGAVFGDLMTQKHLSFRNTYLSQFFKSPFFLASYVGIALLCAFLIYWAADIVEPQHLGYGFAAATGLIVFIICITGFLNRLKTNDALDRKISSLGKLASSHAANWMVDQQYIATIGLQSEETWTFATELTYVIQPESVLFKAHQRNLNKGASYKYFMPDRPKVHKIVADYKRLHKFQPGQVEFILIPHSEFLFYTVISVYNVRTDLPRVIEWLPNRNIDTWIETDEEHAMIIAGIGETLIRKYADRYSSQHTADSATKIQKDT